MAANMKVSTRRLGEDIAALSDRLAAMQRTAAELAPALDAPRADALTEQLDRLDALLDRLDEIQTTYDVGEIRRDPRGREHPAVRRATMADYNETLRALRRDAAELERIAGGTGAYWVGAAAENFRRQFTALQTCQLADLLDTLGAAAGDETPALPTEFIL